MGSCRNAYAFCRLGPDRLVIAAEDRELPPTATSCTCWSRCTAGKTARRHRHQLAVTYFRTQARSTRHPTSGAMDLISSQAGHVPGGARVAHGEVDLARESNMICAPGAAPWTRTPTVWISAGRPGVRYTENRRQRRIPVLRRTAARSSRSPRSPSGLDGQVKEFAGEEPEKRVIPR